ncbi:MAG: ABC transporter ATP-binding protein/permease [Alphaproteobacteria bacterium]|nr:ABC transporter ATP-binding protein/permease [Alphaproteobacteria bacterium]
MSRPHPRRAAEPPDAALPAADEPAPRPALKVARALAPYLWPKGRPDLRWRVVIALLAMVVAKLLTVWTPLLYKALTDGFAQALGGAGEETGSAIALAAVAVPLALIGGYAIARLSAALLQQVRDGLFAAVSEEAQRAIAVRTFRHLHALSLRFHLDRRTGGLARAIERGTRAIDFLLRFSLFSILPTVIELVLACLILWVTFDLRFPAVTLLAVAAYVGFTFLVTEWRVKIRRRMNERDSEANTRAIDSLLNFETVKYFGNERHEADRFDHAMAGYQAAALRTATSLSWLNAGQAVILHLCLVALMLMVGFGLAAGDYTIGDLVLVNALLIQLYVPLNALGFVYREIKQSLIDSEKLFGLLDIEPEVVDAPGARPLSVSRAEIRFEEVGFAYDPRRPILREVSFTIPPGRTLAVVGPTGAGKSTLSRLLFRFYDVGSGRIRIDGQDIAQVTQDSLRSAIGVVPQDTVLFNDTIGYNIRYGRPDASQAEVEAAARLAQIHDFILSLPDGYDTRVGERGLKLSGGEKQRVAIARTILKDPPILILDEATSALDLHTERDIQGALRGVMRARTTLVIAHRLSTIVDADEILVMEEGRVVERGSHAGLLARGGAYAALWARQAEGAPAADDVAEEAAPKPLPAAD